MQAILLPFTYISENVCEAVKTCFQQVRIYQPTRRLVPLQLLALSQKGLVDIAIPADDDDNKIDILVKDYRKWAGLHRGGVLDYLKRQKGSIPFFDDTATLQIKADIKGTAVAPGPQDPLLNARVFLQIAQSYDLESEEIARKFAATNQAERNLFMNIIGEPEAPVQNALRPKTMEGIDSAGYMIPPRILAWSQLFLKDSAFDPTGKPTVFVTTHREALEFLMEQAPAAEHVLKLASLPIISCLSEGYADWQNELSRILDSFPENAGAMAANLIARFGVTDPSNLKVDLAIYRIPGESPSVFFARCVDHPLKGAKRGLPEEREYTLIGLVEITKEAEG
ncbi:MAG: hypothetical protein P1P89_21070 [Desulfobacterales bacterium]|nr:hypothetical protein [Desulfobacterales bacterium]